MPKIFLTNQMITDLLNQKERTGVGAEALLRNRRKEKPKRLNAAIITSWMRRKTVSANKQNFEYVMNLYQGMPDNPWIILTPGQKEELKIRYEAFHGQLAVLFKKHPPPSVDISYSAVRKLLTGETDKVRKATLNYIDKLAEP